MRGRQFPGIHPVAVSISYVYSDRTEVTQIIPQVPLPARQAKIPQDPLNCPTMHIRSPPFQARGKQASTKQPDKWENAPMFRRDFMLSGFGETD